MAFADLCGLRYIHVEIADTVTPQHIAADVSESLHRCAGVGACDPLARRQGTEQVSAARGNQVVNRHARDIQISVEIGTDGTSDQAIDASQSQSGIASVQRAEWRAALEGDERPDLPATYELLQRRSAHSARRDLIYEVGREAMRPVVGRASTVGTPIDRSAFAARLLARLEEGHAPLDLLKLPLYPYQAVGVLFLGMGFMIYVPQMLIAAMAMNLATKRAAAAAVGMTGIFGYASTIVSGVGLGRIVDRSGWNGAFILLIVVSAATAVLMLLTWNVGAHAEPAK